MSRPRKPTVQERRQLLIGLGIGALAFIGYRAFTGEKSSQSDVSVKTARISFDEVQKNSDPVFRQSYINQFTAQFKREFIKGVVYDAKGSPDKPAALADVMYVVGDEGVHKQYTVRVYPNCFEHETQEKENDVLSAIIDHEIDSHARTFYEGLPSIGEKAFNTVEGHVHAAYFDVHEIRAHLNQLDKGKMRGISDSCANSAIAKTRQHYTNLLRADRTFAMRDPLVFDRAATELFRKNFLTVKTEGKHLVEQEGNRYIWIAPDASRIYLPEPVCEKIRQVK